MSPLPAPSVPRRHIHTRRVVCNGYRRDDGLWEIEAHLADTKSYCFHTSCRGAIEPGDPVHSMWMRVTLTDQFEVVDIAAMTEKSPFADCGAVVADYQRLVGLTMGAGWNRVIKERLGGVRGCTHLTELLGPVATTAFQTIYPILAREQTERAKEHPLEHPVERPALLDVCHVFDTNGAYVREHWPDHYTGPSQP